MAQEPRQLSRRRFLFLVIALPLVLVVISQVLANREKTIGIREIRTIRGSTLYLAVNSCNASHRVEVSEAASAVRVKVFAKGDSSDDCEDGVRVRLRAPLADRAVIDETTGNRVPIGPLEPSPPQVPQGQG